MPIYAADPKHIPDKIGLSDEEKKNLIDKSQLLLPRFLYGNDEARDSQQPLNVA
jgi:hypothetical protein